MAKNFHCRTRQMFSPPSVCVWGCHFYAFDTRKHTHTQPPAEKLGFGAKKRAWTDPRTTIFGATLSYQLLVGAWLVGSFEYFWMARVILHFLEYRSWHWYDISYFFYCLEKHTRIFIKVAKVCKFAVCQVLILKFSNKLKPTSLLKKSNSPQNEDWSILALWPAGKTTEVTVRRWPFSTTMWGARIGTYSNIQPGRTNVCHISAELFGHGKHGPWLAGWLAGCSG